VTRTPLARSKVKGQGHKAALVGCTGRPTWSYSNGDLCVHEVYRVTTCRPGRGHIVAAARLQLAIIHKVVVVPDLEDVWMFDIKSTPCCTESQRPETYTHHSLITANYLRQGGYVLTCVCLSVCVCVSVYLCVCLSVCLSICLCLSVCL